jgi:hypothetical protein
MDDGEEQAADHCVLTLCSSLLPADKITSLPNGIPKLFSASTMFTRASRYLDLIHPSIPYFPSCCPMICRYDAQIGCVPVGMTFVDLVRLRMPAGANAPVVLAVHFGRPAIFNTNHGRPHQAIGNHLPMAASREGISGGLLETAVDMTLRLDDAKALPGRTTPTTNCGLICWR